MCGICCVHYCSGSSIPWMLECVSPGIDLCYMLYVLHFGKTGSDRISVKSVQSRPDRMSHSVCCIFMMQTNGRRFLPHDSQDPFLAYPVELSKAGCESWGKDSVHHHLCQSCLANQNQPLGQLAEIWKGGHGKY